MHNQQKTKRGFTIIEVVLVLAIAGLIFMMVFLALPALQRSQRDRQRQQDMGRLVATITEYQSNNRGQIPSGIDKTKNTSWVKFAENYLGWENGFSGPNNPYSITLGSCTSGGSATCTLRPSDSFIIANDTADSASTSTEASPGDERIFIFTNAQCLVNSISDNSPTKAVETASPTSSQVLNRKVAVLIRLEGSGVYYCNTN